MNSGKSSQNYLNQIFKESLTKTWNNAAVKLEPDPDITLSDFADRFRVTSQESNDSPGRWKTSNAEFQRGIMDAISDRHVEKVVIQASSQVGKSEILLNAVAYFARFKPRPLLLIQPTVEMAEDFSKKRIGPMIRDSPEIKKVFARTKSRDSDSTILSKMFTGGYLQLVGANSPAGLASRPIGAVFADEIDRFESSAGREGDPLDLAIKRTNNFRNRKIILVSTPTIKGVSRIELAMLETDQRRYFVKCPGCNGKPFWLQFDYLDFKENDPKNARLKCPNCARLLDDMHRDEMILKGIWKPTAKPSSEKNRGFFLNELYSPWRTFAEVVESYLEAKKIEERLIVWTNTSKGETYEPQAKTISDEKLFERRQKYSHPAPAGVLIVSAGVDVQPDRFEIEFVGWGIGEESWNLDFQVIYTNTRDLKNWNELLTLLLSQKFKRFDGTELPVYCTAIDTGGSSTDESYQFLRGKKGLRIFGIKGDDGFQRPIIGAAQRKRHGRFRRPIDLFIVGADPAKSLLFSRLEIEEPGPGFCHFPETRTQEYFKQLTAEKLFITQTKKGPKMEFRKIEGRRNEALDCRIYAHAALRLAAPKFETLAPKYWPIQKPTTPEENEPESAQDTAHNKSQPKPQKKTSAKTSRKKPGSRRRKSFLNSW
jgi:phage terminase large subunit GpA-like protein